MALLDVVVGPEQWLPLRLPLASGHGLPLAIRQQQVWRQLEDSEVAQVILGEVDDPGPHLRNSLPATLALLAGDALYVFILPFIIWLVQIIWL